MSQKTLRFVFLLLLALSASSAFGQAPPSPAQLISAQQEAMKPLAIMDGVWRGPAWTIPPSGEKHDIIQTERIGPFLDGSVKVLEGRGYDLKTSQVTFNAFGTVAYDVAKKSYTLHSYAQGRAGDFPLTVTSDGYVWEIPAGPMTIRYTAVIKDGAWREVGDRIATGKEPVGFFEMNLKRIGDTRWPADGAVPMK
jgi:hypothetical protein